jgi:DNA polymerase IV (DinB-like DNA polymerase)
MAGGGNEREGGRSSLPGVSQHDSTDRIVLHVDMDCFYAACERRREPLLEDEPVVVGMGYEPGTDSGAVATASYEAREFGVESAQAISAALSRLPNRERVDFEDGDIDLDRAETGYYRSVDMEYYQSVSEDVREILRESADRMREVSIDEAYLDVTERTAWDAVPAGDSEGEDGGSSDGSSGGRNTGSGERTLAAGFARHLGERIAEDVGVTASIGVAPNMSAAKIASDFDKPDGLIVVPPGEVADFLAPLSIEAVHGVGPVRARELNEMGIETAGDLTGASPRALADRFGERGRDLYERARGNDDRAVIPKGKPKSLNRESAFPEATGSAERWREVVCDLASEVADRAIEEGALYRTIGIKVVTPPFEVSTRARSLSGPVQDVDLVKRVALELLDEFDGATIRKLGVRVSNLDFAAADQSNLSNWGATNNGADTRSGSRADRAIDRSEASGQASLTDFDRQ